MDIHLPGDLYSNLEVGRFPAAKAPVPSFYSTPKGNMNEISQNYRATSLYSREMFLPIVCSVRSMRQINIPFKFQIDFIMIFLNVKIGILSAEISIFERSEWSTNDDFKCIYRIKNIGIGNGWPWLSKMHL